MAELQFPNIAGSFYGGYANGLNARLVKEGEQRRSRLSELAGQAYAAPQDQRQGLIAQAVGVDPEAGFALEGSLGKSDDARAQTLVNAAKYLQAAPEAQRASVWRTMQPQLAQKLGIDLPVDYNDEVAQTAQAIVQTYGGAQSDGVRGSVVGRRIVNPVTGEVIYEAPQETQYQWSEANGAWIPKPGGESAPAAAPAGGTVFRTSNGELFDVSQVTDPTFRAEIMSKPEQYGLIAEAGGGSVDLGRRDVSQQQSPGLAAIPVAGIGPKVPTVPEETFSQPQAVTNPQTGKQELVQFGNRGGRRVVGDYAPGATDRDAKPPTEGERKAATLLRRLTGSLAQLETAVKESPSAASPNLTASAVGKVFGETAANAITPAARQRVEAAQLDILDAALTLGTGAAYTREQLEGYRKSFFPQIGDSQATIDDKAARLNNVIESARIAAGRAGPNSEESAPQAAPAASGWGIQRVD